MKHTLSACFIFCCSFLFHFYAQAQDARSKQTLEQNTPTAVPADTSANKPKKTYAGISINYVNDNVYLGRKDSLRVPYLSPKIGYYNKYGFFAEIEFGFNTSSANSGLEMFTAAAGYGFEAGNYEGQFTASDYSYSSNSTSVKSEIKGSVEYANGYDFGFIKPTLVGNINFGTKTDYAATFGLEHSFYAADSKLEITPTAVANASTQNYYSNYYKVRKYNPKRKTKPLPNGVASISGEVLNAAAFKMLDYEVSVPVHYETGKWTFGFIPTYAIPVHPAEVLITTKLNNGTSNTHTVTEKIANTFFGVFEILVKI